MVIFYLLLMGRIGECNEGYLSFFEFHRNYPYLVGYALTFVLPVILSWVFYFAYSPKTWVKYWLYGLMTFGAILTLFMFARMGWSIATNEMVYDDISFREPFSISGVIAFGRFIYVILFMLFLPWFWFDKHDKKQNRKYGKYYGLAILTTFILCFDWMLPPPPPIHTYGGEQLLFIVAFGWSSIVYLIYYSIVHVWKHRKCKLKS